MLILYVLVQAHRREFNIGIGLQLSNNMYGVYQEHFIMYIVYALLFLPLIPDGTSNTVLHLKKGVKTIDIMVFHIWYAAQSVVVE